MEDWHIPFMLFELSSYAQSKAREKRQQLDKETATEMNNFFNEDDPGEAMDFFWDNLIIGDD